jgi:hypothetical protein
MMANDEGLSELILCLLRAASRIAWEFQENTDAYQAGKISGDEQSLWRALSSLTFQSKV